MLEELNLSFEKALRENKNILIENHKLSDGIYILANQETGEFQELIVDKDDICENIFLYEKIKKFDFHSSYISSNKSYFDKKISSVVYTAISIKGENLKLNKLSSKNWDVKEALEQILKNFDLYENPRSKYKDKIKLALYEIAEKKYGCVDKNLLEKFKQWVQDNIHQIAMKYNDKKTKYIKIFLDTDVEIYIKEQMKYLYVNLLNNVEILNNGDIVGVHSFNITLNSKKLFLFNKPSKSKYSILIDINKAINYYWMSKLLDSFAMKKKNVVYFGKTIKAYNKRDINMKEIVDIEAKYFVLLKNKNGRAIIEDFDTLNNFKDRLIKVKIEDVMNRSNFNIKEDFILNNLIDEDNEKFILNRMNIIDLLDELFFCKSLKTNLLLDKITIKSSMPNIDINDLSYMIYVIKKPIEDYLYKGIDKNFDKLFKEITLKSLRSFLQEYGSTNKNLERFIVREAILDALEDNRNNKEKIDKAYSNLKNKMFNLSNCNGIENIEEYSFAMGQLIYYLSNNSYIKGKNSNKVNFINLFLNIKKNKKLKYELDKIIKMFSLRVDDRKLYKFKILYSYVLEYDTNEVCNPEFMMAGFLYENLCY